MTKRLVYLSGAPRVSTHPEAETTGARSHMLGVLGAFRQLGWTVETFIAGDRVPPSWSSSGSHRAISKTLLRRAAADLIRILLGQVNARRVRRSFRGRADLIYERFGAFQALGAACRQQGTPWVLETNGPLFYEARVERKSLVLSGLARRMESKAYHECDLLLCVTQALKEIVVEAFGISAEKVVVIPNGVDTAFFDPARYQPKRLFPTLTVGFVGNLYIWSGVDLLIQAIAELRSEGMSISAVVVGDGVMRSEWEALAQQLGIMQHVAFTGRVSRDLVPTYIAGFDVGYSGQRALQLGHMYHSPLKIYEYMSMAKPVIASAFQDAQDALRDGIDGFLFIPSDKESLKQALRRASVSQDALGGMGEAARIQALKFHSWTARISSLMRAVDQLTAGPRVPRSRLTDRGGAP